MTPSPEPTRQFIFAEDRPFASCHASTVLPLDDGRALAAWFAGSHEKSPDVAIWMSTRDSEGEWSPPRKVADQDGLPHWNPVLARAPDGRLHLFYKVGPDCMIWRTRVLTSPDAGVSWSEPIEPPPVHGFPVGPVENKAIVLADGTWLAPTSLETEISWDSAVTISRDNGASWGETITLEDEDPRTDERGVELDRAHRPNEFSYPAIVVVRNRLLVTYTWKRERICFREIALDD